MLNLDFVAYSALGLDLSKASKATLETLRLPSRVLLPFLVLVILSFLTRRDEKAPLDRYFAKMNTPVDPDPEADRLKLDAAYTDGVSVNRVFPHGDLEFVWPGRKDVIGFVVACFVCVFIIGLLLWLASIGAKP